MEASKHVFRVGAPLITERATTNGHKVFTVPRISDEYLTVPLFLYPSVKDAEASQHIGGSAFLVRYPTTVEGAAHHLYAVTNKHVIRRFHSPVIRVNKLGGGFDVIPLTENDWTDHPDGDDISVAMIGNLSVDFHEYGSIPIGMFVNSEVIGTWGIGIGDDVFSIGRFVHHEGITQNLPALRFGTISMMPVEPVHLGDGGKVEAFLIEARSVPGYSGSPVFLMQMEVGSARQFQYSDEEDLTVKVYSGPPRVGYGPWLLGVDFGHIYDPDFEIEERIGPDQWEVHSELRAKSNTGMMMVAPAWRILTLLEDDRIKIPRDAIDTYRLKEKEQGKHDSGVEFDAAEGETTREQFHDALRRASRKTSEPDSSSEQT